MRQMTCNRVLIGCVCMLFAASIFLPIHRAFALSPLNSDNGQVYYSDTLTSELIESNDRISIDSVSISNDSFSFDGSILSDAEYDFSYYGELNKLEFSDGTASLIGSCFSSSESHELIRLAIIPDTLQAKLVLYSKFNDLYLYTNYDISKYISAETLSSIMSGMDELRGEEALTAYSLLSSQEDGYGVPTEVNDYSSMQFSSSGGISTYASSYSGYRDLIDDVNSGITVKPSSYDVDLSAFNTTGWHHDKDWGLNPYAFASLVVNNGPDEYLVQVSLCDLYRIGQSASFSDGIGTVGLEMQYRGGFVGVYDRSSGTLSVRFSDLGLMVKNAQVAAGGLTNKAVFISQEADVVCGGGMSISALIDLRSPTAAISSLLDYLTTQRTQSSAIFLYFDDSYAAQLSRYDGKVIRTISTKCNSGYLNYYESPVTNNHRVTTRGVVRLYNNVETDYTWSWKYTCEGSI